LPAISENIARWRAFYWGHGGEEWSYWWGSPKAQWHASIYPRIAPFLPAGLIVEIAPGYGRWTVFLRHHCESLVGVDLSPECIAACEHRFRKDKRLAFRRNDGKTLTGVPDRSVDLVFSFDSLVHAEQDVLDAYLAEIARVLDSGGVAFLHHSNMAENLRELNGQEMPHWRARTVSAETVAGAAAAAGLSCFRQELVPWGRKHPFLIDCFSWIARPDSPHHRSRQVVRNEAFMDEADEAFAAEARRRRYRPRNLLRGLARRRRRHRAH
jgi:SAM-dependent methyltransferase